jgi:hypothetical protein
MKIFFSASPHIEDSFKQIYQKIYKEIESLGYEHIDDEATSMSNQDSISPNDKSRDEQIKKYNNKVNAIKKADICIFETSSHSLSTGFLINVSLDQQKPTIALYYEEMAHKKNSTRTSRKCT